MVMVNPSKGKRVGFLHAQPDAKLLINATPKQVAENPPDILESR
jgi:hypothetical protein